MRLGFGLDRANPDDADGTDPLIGCWAITTLFFVLLLVRIDVPSFQYFDESFYIPAAARLWLGMDVANREHPMLAKELMALAMGLFGNQPFAWRIGSVVAGSLGLLAAMRALWWYSHSRRATLLFGILLASHGLLFSMSRIAMLDVYMFAFTSWAVMLFTQRQLVASGTAFGLALACKWSAFPVLAAFAAIDLYRDRSHRPFVRFAAVPLLVYFATFLPGTFVRTAPLTLTELVPMQLEMFSFMVNQHRPHAYESDWWQWVLNLRPMWLYHRGFDGAFRLGVLGGNPLSSLAIIPAVVLALRRNAVLPAAIFVLCLAFWALSEKNTQFYYYYLLPVAFGLAVLAAELARTRIAVPFAVLTLAVFAWLYPALTGMPVERGTERLYTWQPGWDFRD